MSRGLLKDGEVVQEYAYVPYSPEFSLAGTLNASMHFADLGAGEYTYQLTAAAENKGETVETVLIEVHAIALRERRTVHRRRRRSLETPLHLRAEWAPAASSGKKRNTQRRRHMTPAMPALYGTISSSSLITPTLRRRYSAASTSESSCEPTRVEGDFYLAVLFLAGLYRQHR